MRFQESDESNASQLDFVPRDRRNQSVRMILAFVVIMALIFVFGYSPGVNGNGYAPVIAIVIVGVLCFYVVSTNQKNLDLVMATEYQNLLFAQAVKLGSDFCLFVRRNGTIVYADRGTRDIFGHGDQGEAQALEAVFEKAGIGMEDRERILGSIYHNLSDRLVFPIVTAGVEKDYILTVEPIARPAGYVLVRGREFRGDRAALGNATPREQ